jgi:hypothetical protein
MQTPLSYLWNIAKYSKISIRRFRRRSWKRAIGTGKLLTQGLHKYDLFRYYRNWTTDPGKWYIQELKMVASLYCSFTNLKLEFCVINRVPTHHTQVRRSLLYREDLMICIKSPHIHKFDCVCKLWQQKKTPWPLVRKRTIPTDRPPLVGEIWWQILWIEGCHVVSAVDPHGS